MMIKKASFTKLKLGGVESVIDIDLNARSPLRLSKNGNFSPNQKQSVKPILKKEESKYQAPVLN